MDKFNTAVEVLETAVDVFVDLADQYVPGGLVGLAIYTTISAFALAVFCGLVL